MWWSYVVATVIAFLNMIWVNISYIIGAATDGGDWWNVLYAVMFDAAFLGLAGILHYILMPRMAAYYRWREQDWWKWDHLFELGGTELENIEFEDY